VIEIRDILGAAVLTVALLAVFAAAEVWRRRRNPPAEWTRKFVHVGTGLVCLGFPWLVRSPWLVTGMGVVASALLTLGHRAGALRSVSGVTRRTSGVQFYPLAVALTYALAYGRPWLYVASILTLAVCDAFAALIGLRYGRLRYSVEEESKSVEGSLAFLLLAFLAILLPALVMARLPVPVCLLSALLVATVVTGFEAISLSGSDNLFVPLAAGVILAKISSKPLPEIAAQNASLAAIALLVGILARRMPALNTGAVVTLILFAFGAWSLGSWLWALPVLIGLVAYNLLISSLPPSPAAAPVRVRVVVRALLPPLYALILSNTSALDQTFLGPYVAVFATTVALTLWSYQRRTAEAGSPALLGRGLLCCLLWGWLTVAVPGAFRGVPFSALFAPAALVATALLLEAESQGRTPSEPTDELWPAGRTLVCYAVLATTVLAQVWGIVPSW
jgi:phytol kinase